MGDFQKVVAIAGLTLELGNGKVSLGVTSHSRRIPREVVVVTTATQLTLFVLVVLDVVVAEELGFKASFSLFSLFVQCSVVVPVAQNMALGVDRLLFVDVVVVGAVIVTVVTIVVVVIIDDVVVKVDGGCFPNGIDQGIGTTVGKERVDVMGTAAMEDGDVVLGDPVQTVSRVGTELLGPLLVPILVSVTVLTVVVVVVDRAFGPTARRTRTQKGRKKGKRKNQNAKTKTRQKCVSESNRTATRHGSSEVRKLLMAKLLTRNHGL